jgi:peptidoglycan/xylan/chitin deacetylase (PgdA/CDA1 family)
MRRVIKAAAEQLLSTRAAVKVASRRLSDDVLILGYHNVVPDNAKPGSDVALHLTRRDFAAQLDRLMRTHDVVRLDEALHAAPSRRPRAAITFDDAYRGAMTVGMDELRQRGMPATVFVAPGFLHGGVFWWDEIEWPASTDAGTAFRGRALAECSGCDADVRALAQRLGYGTVSVPEYARCVTEDELRDIIGRGGLTIGAHSWSHPNLAALDDASLHRELSQPLSWLRAHFDGVMPWLAYPYGTWSPRVASSARSVGYELAVRAAGGWLRRRAPDHDPLTLPRYCVPAGLSTRGFALRTAGFFCE